jgi:hypothetical protein
MELQRRQQQMFMDLPTIEDEKIDQTPKDFISLSEESRRHDGILNEFNDMERMLELGKLAMNDPKELERIFAMPTFL